MIAVTLAQQSQRGGKANSMPALPETFRWVLKLPRPEELIGDLVDELIKGT